MSATFYQQLQEDAEYIAERAGQLLKRYQKTATVVVQKDIGDFAMTADLASEKLIRTYIQKKYPGHSVMGEEGGLTDKHSEYLWIIDPLDGTKEYARGIPEYNCLIAVEHEGKLVVGVIRRNGLVETYTCAAGGGAWGNKKPIHVSKQADLSRAYIGYHLPVPTSTARRRDVERHFDILKELTFSCYRLRPSWDDAKSMAWVAQGILDAHIIPAELKNEWHDVASGILLVQEAGGKVTHLDGSPVISHDMSKGFLTTNGVIHDELLSILRKELL